MDTCPKCKALLRIGKTYMTFKNDDTPDAPTEAYTNLPMICVNKSCENYESNGDEPTKIVTTISNKVN